MFKMLRFTKCDNVLNVTAGTLPSAGREDDVGQFTAYIKDEAFPLRLVNGLHLSLFSLRRGKPSSLYL